MELLCDGLTGHQTTLADEKSTFRIKCSDCQYNLLGTVLQHASLTLLKEAEQEADGTRAQTLDQSVKESRFGSVN